MLRRAVFTMIAGFLATPTHAGDFPLSGERGKVREEFMGCRDQADFKKVVMLISSGDEQAFNKFIIQRYPDCRPIKTGAEIFVEGKAMLGDLVCARPKGEVDCFWFLSKLTVKRGRIVAHAG
ncbi:hypothetical protein [Microvirga calopogonii]|uniref:hypothetical protein n=1 Tax=Microvirga calopogonii TaxID=2078013 RepID=UPI000E0CE8E2|nr:hypothetical protein [Microvirga calopogonii]